MKKRWRQHELLLATIVTAIALAAYLWQLFMLSPEQEAAYARPFLSENRSFSYFNNILLLQVGPLLLLYVCYCWINLVTVPGLLKSSVNPWAKYTLASVQLLIIVFLLGPGFNIATFYLNPYYFKYARTTFFPIIGSHPQPYTNLGGGAGAVLAGVTVYGIYVYLREYMLAYIDRSGARKAYLTTVVNQVTAFVLVFISVYAFVRIFNIIGGSLFAILYFSLAPVLFLVWLIYQQRKTNVIQLRGMEQALERSTANLQFLRSQINPHFLFNALNTLYGTALQEGMGNTAAGIQKLGDMMRFMLHENNKDFIPMQKEIDYLENYIALQKLRTKSSPHIDITDSIDAAHCHHQVAPMLMIPLVENAFKHGISLQQKSWIDIRLRCSEDEICFEVRNSLHARSPINPEWEKSGIGLQNVTERLKLIYPGKHQLVIDKHANEYAVRLTIRVKP